MRVVCVCACVCVSVCVRCILRQTADGFHYISGRVRCKTCENSDIALPSPPISKSVHRRDRMVGRASERAMRADSYRASFGWDFPPCRALAANFEQKTFTRILTVYELWLGNKQKRKIFEYVYLEEQKCVLICYSRWSTGACVSVSTLSRLRWNRDTDFPLDFECQRNGSTTRLPLPFKTTSDPKSELQIRCSIHRRRRRFVPIFLALSAWHMLATQQLLCGAPVFLPPQIPQNNNDESRSEVTIPIHIVLG